MRTIVCGAGQVGYQIARYLAQENNDVTIVDRQESLVRKAMETLDVGGVIGFASYPDILKNAGADDAEMIVAATRSDEVNMVACQVAHSVFSVPNKIARVRAQSYLRTEWSDLYRKEHLPIDSVISPELEVASSVMRRIELPAAFDSVSFLQGEARFIGLRLTEDCPIVHTPLRQLTELFNDLRALVVGIERAGELRIPDEDDQLYENDAVYLFAAQEDVARAIRLFGVTETELRSVTIIGGGNIGQEVARRIEAGKSGKRVRIIERNRERAEEAASKLSHSVVLLGDGLDPDIMREAQLGQSDVVVALTDNDRTNFLSCAIAKQSGCKRALSLANEPTLNVLGASVDIDAFIDPRQTTVSSILRHVRRGRVSDVYSVHDGEAEVIEAQISASAPIEGQQLRNVRFPAAARVGAVLSKNEYKMPTGDMVLEEGDIVVIFSMRQAVREVEALFQESLDYL